MNKRDMNSSYSQYPNKKRKKKKTKLSRILGWLVPILVVAALVTAGIGIFMNYYNKMNIVDSYEDPESLDEYSEADEESEDFGDGDESDDEPEESDIESSEEESVLNDKQALAELIEEAKKNGVSASSKDIYNILLIGVDSRTASTVAKTSGSRSDTMILVTINKKIKRITMASFMRDTWVTIPGHGENRLNVAFYYGINTLFATLKQNFDIEVDQFAVINFNGFEQVVDAIGGLDITVTNKELKNLNKNIENRNFKLGLHYNTNKLPVDGEGTFHMNGAQVLGYVRIRKVGNGDYQRTQRQRDTIVKILEKVKTLPLTEINDLANTLLPLITTNMSASTLFGYVVGARTYLNYEICSIRIPYGNSAKGAMIDKKSVILADYGYNHDIWYSKAILGQ